MQGVELGGIEGEVHIAPPHGIRGLLVLHTELVLGAAAREFAGIDGQRTAIGKDTLSVQDGELDELSRCKVPVGIAHMSQTDLRQVCVLRFLTELLHVLFSWNKAQN